MRQLGAVFALLACLVTAGVVRLDELPKTESSELQPPEQVDPSHLHALDAAEFAVEELRRLSESGIYETLALKRIHHASTQVGVFHNNTFLTLELTSPHLLDAESSLHDVIVMQDLDDGVRSIAIDEFPVMQEEAIERFWIRQVEKHKQEREALFARLIAEGQDEEAVAKKIPPREEEL